MRAKEYLQQIRKLDIRIGQRITQLNEMRARVHIMGSFDYSKDRVQSSPSSGNKQIEELVDFEKDLKVLIIREQLLKDKIIGEIQQLENPIHVDLLFRRYLECQSFERISCDMGYTYNYTLNLHGVALQAFEDQVLMKC